MRFALVNERKLTARRYFGAAKITTFMSPRRRAHMIFVPSGDQRGLTNSPAASLTSNVARLASLASGSRSRILCIFNLIDSAQHSLEIRGELVESPHPYGQVASVAILRISAILLDV
jgi:hypothetical protein